MTPRSSGEPGILSIDDLLGQFRNVPTGRSGSFRDQPARIDDSDEPDAECPAGFDMLHLYQIQRVEDESLRYRLRLGPFENEDEADAALLKVRDDYPCALTATAARRRSSRHRIPAQAETPDPPSEPSAHSDPHRRARDHGCAIAGAPAPKVAPVIATPPVAAPAAGHGCTAGRDERTGHRDARDIFDARDRRGALAALVALVPAPTPARAPAQVARALPTARVNSKARKPFDG